MCTSDFVLQPYITKLSDKEKLLSPSRLDCPNFIVKFFSTVCMNLIKEVCAYPYFKKENPRRTNNRTRVFVTFQKRNLYKFVKHLYKRMC